MVFRVGMLTIVKKIVVVSCARTVLLVPAPQLGPPDEARRRYPRLLQHGIPVRARS